MRPTRSVDSSAAFSLVLSKVRLAAVGPPMAERFPRRSLGVATGWGEMLSRGRKPISRARCAGEMGGLTAPEAISILPVPDRPRDALA
jgi:hypothetical protein